LPQGPQQLRAEELAEEVYPGLAELAECFQLEGDPMNGLQVDVLDQPV
jgi:hypothetical protein